MNTYHLPGLTVTKAVSFDVQDFLNLMQSHLSIPTLVSWAIEVLFRK
jgi:hypothetical protein